MFLSGTSLIPTRLECGRSPHAYVNQRLQIQLELLMMSDVPLETCSAYFDELWNNKFRYQVASCWLLLLKILLFENWAQNRKGTYKHSRQYEFRRY